MMKKNPAINIGTSGWYYEHWIGSFYPSGTVKKDFLKYYIEHFNTVEINTSFYNLPTQKTFQQWKQSVPADFIFAVKASRYITHMKKLKDPQASIHKFFAAISVLGEKTGPVLFQLPPRWGCNVERLESFLRVLPRQYQYAIEFRDPSWFSEEVYSMLKKYGVAFCIYELDGRMSPKEVTGNFVYVRLHGPAGAYQGKYSTKVLAAWAKDFLQWQKQGKAVYCYFDNDQAGYAAQNGAKLKQIMFEKGAEPVGIT